MNKNAIQKLTGKKGKYFLGESFHQPKQKWCTDFSCCIELSNCVGGKAA